MHHTFEELDEMYIDVLKEIGNIGAGNAATSLSLMLGRPIGLELPKVHIMDFDSAANSLGGAEALTCSVAMNLEGDINGMLMFMLQEQFAGQLLEVLLGKRDVPYHALDDLARSTITEVGNILSSSYVRCICELADMDVRVNVPEFSLDMAGAVMSVPIIRFGAKGNRVLFIEENFVAEDQRVKSHMILFAEIESLNRILEKLGIL